MRRFPDLAALFSLKSESDIPPDIPEHLMAPLEIIPSKASLPTARENGKLLHSLYNPSREAEQAAQAAKKSVSDAYSCAFFSCGLGYTPISYARLFPNDTLIIIESDPRYFFTALSCLDWSDIFSHAHVILAIATGIESVVSLIENTAGIKHTAISENPAQSQHSAEYFKALRTLISRNRQKHEINDSTLEKFSRLWLKNTCRNLPFLASNDGITMFKDTCPQDLPVVILAAGPTLEEALPHLKEIKKRAILVAVDTALRASLRAGVEPDFVVLADPQYYAYRHIAGLSSPSSILITESAAYPAVFRFPCKKIIMCASLFPLGHYIESQIGSKGPLVAGGSVSTTAWDFARYIGAGKIFCSGLDLGFPDFQTHIKGSTFEENTHTVSGRLSPAETRSASLLFAGGMQLDKDYEGNEILTDSKMKMFAWWFESKNEEFKNRIQTYSLSPKSLKIPGIEVSTLQDFLKLPDASREKEAFFAQAEEKSAKEREKSACTVSKFKSAIEKLKNGLEELYNSAKKGLRISEEGLVSPFPAQYLARLEQIDSQILHSQYKEIASLVFPTEGKLSKLYKELPPLADEVKVSFQKSKVIYKELMKGINEYQKNL